jgi:uroporphyrinogen-III synthase
VTALGAERVGDLLAAAPAGPAPLAGKRVAVTRPDDRAHGVSAMLAALGATVLAHPAIAIAPPESYDALDAALARLDAYDWLALTSVAAARAVADRLAALGVGRPLGGTRPRVAAVGTATERAAAAWLGRVDLSPAEHTAEALAAALLATVPAPAATRVLFPCADRARDALPDALRAAGVQVDRVVAYRTLPADLSALAERVVAGEIDAVLLASPSAAEAYVRALAGRASHAALVCIGPTTADAVRALGLPAGAVAAAPTDEALVDATRACLGRAGEVEYEERPKAGPMPSS